MLNQRSVVRTLVLAVAIVLALPIVAQAEAGDEQRGRGRGPGGPHRGDRRGPDPGHFVDRHGDELGLDAETRASIQAVVDTTRAQADASRTEIRGEHETMRALLSQSSPDEAAVMSQNDRIETLKSQQRKNRLEAMLAIRKMLTPEQREQLVGMQEAERAGRGEGRRFRDGTEPGGEDSKRKGRHRPRPGCREDVETLCAEAEPGRARLQCLDAQWDNLSDDCRAAFEGRGARRDRRSESVPE
jgi:Spy/CpxP family protein refolding chaperone